MRYSIVIILFILISCNKDKTEYKNINFHFSSESNENISKYIKSYKIIPLETSDFCFFASANKIKISNTRIFVFESIMNIRDEILMFNLEGKFIAKLNSQGRGPQEYLSISDFDIERNKELISIIDPGNRKLINYYFNSDFVDEIELDFYVKELLYSYQPEDTTKVFVTRMSYINKDNNDIHVFDQNNHQVYSALPFDKPLGIVLGNSMSLFSTIDGVSYLLPNSNMIYEIGNQEIKPKYLLDFSYKVLPSDEIEDVFFKGKEKSYNFVHSIQYFESVKTIYTQFMHDRKPFIGLYDKISDKSIVFQDQIDPSCGCGITLKLKGVLENSFIIECENSKLEKTLNSIDPDRSKCTDLTFAKKGYLPDITSNPVLILIEFEIP